MQESVSVFREALEDKVYQTSTQFQKLREVIPEKCKSLKNALESLVYSATDFYKEFFPQEDRGFDSVGGFYNSIKLKTAFFLISVKVLIRDLPEIANKNIAEIKPILESIRKNNEKLFNNMASMPASVVKKLYNLLGDYLTDFKYHSYEFSEKFFGLDSVDKPSKLLLCKKIIDKLIKNCEARRPTYTQEWEEHKIDLKKPAPGCPAFEARDEEDGKSLPDIVADWFGSLLEEYIYPELLRFIAYETHKNKILQLIHHLHSKLLRHRNATPKKVLLQ